MLKPELAAAMSYDADLHGGNRRPVNWWVQSSEFPPAAENAATTTVGVTTESAYADLAAAVAPPPSESEPASIHDYTCPICLELLLRPVQLSCGHRFCRGCWVRVLQSREARATAELSPSPSPSHPDPLTLT